MLNIILYWVLLLYFRLFNIGCMFVSNIFAGCFHFLFTDLIVNSDLSYCFVASLLNLNHLFDGISSLLSFECWISFLSFRTKCGFFLFAIGCAVLCRYPLNSIFFKNLCDNTKYCLML